MDAPRHDDMTLFETGTPRREAVRALGAAGAALLGVMSLGAAAEAQGKGKNRDNNNNNNNNDGKNNDKDKGGPNNLAGLSVRASIGTPFDVGVGGEKGGAAGCNPGELLISGGYDTTTPEGLGDCVPTVLAMAGDPIEWFVVIKCPPTSSATGIRPWAFCLQSK